MKKIILTLFLISIISFDCFSKSYWTQPMHDFYYVNALIKKDNFLFAGTKEGGVFRSSDNGMSWISSNNVISKGFYDISCLASNVNNVFAGTGNGVFLSSDNGESWSPINNGMSNSDVRCLALHGNNIFAGTNREGVFLSTDIGITWNKINEGMRTTLINGLKVIGNDIFAATVDGIFLSSDSGTYWKNNSFGLREFYVNCVENIGNVLLAGTQKGIYISQDKGLNWKISNFDSTTSVLSLKSDNDTIYAGTNGKGLFKSTDFGVTWNPIFNTINSNRSNDIYSLLKSDSNIITGTGNGVYLLNIFTNKWKSANSGITTNTSTINSNIDCIATIGNTIFASSESGRIVRSTNNGISWEKADSGIVKRQLRFIKAIGKTLYAEVGDIGVFHSTDYGNTWISPNILIKNINIYTQNLFAGNENSIFIGIKNEIYRSTDNGVNWSLSRDSSSSYDIACIAVKDSLVIAGNHDGELFITYDSGRSWKTINSNYKYGFNYILINDSSLLATSSYSNSIFISTDFGLSWSERKNNFYNNSNNKIKENNSIIFTCGIQKNMQSTDNGENWILMNDNGLDINGLNQIEFTDSLIVGVGVNQGVITAKLSDLGLTKLDVSLDKSLFFDRICVGSNITKSFEIQNNSSETAKIKSIKAKNYPNSFLIGSYDSVLADNSKKLISVTFQPDKVKRYNDTLIVVFSEPVLKEYYVEINAISIAKTKVWFPDTTAEINQKFAIPIYSKLFCGSEINDQFTGNFSFDKSLLFPNTIQNSGMRIIGIENDLLKSSATGNTIQKSGEIYTLNYINGLILFANQTTTIINLDNFSYGNDLIEVEKKVGSITINKVCVKELRRIVLFENESLSISPNPASDYIEINEGAGSKPALVNDIEIFNIFGERTTPSDLSPALSEREGVKRIDVSNLMPGIYFVRIGDRFEKFVKI
jgi:photosystem II stability/assembly factor-like uncharacterized protein